MPSAVGAASVLLQDDNASHSSHTLPEKHDSQDDRIVWTVFLSACLLVSGFISVVVYSNWEQPVGGVVKTNSFEYLVLCMIGGVFSGLPHTFLVPVDLIKCRVQVGEYLGFSDGCDALRAEAKGSYVALWTLMFRGWAPTFVGYSLQGALKFGLYEFFKEFYNGSLLAQHKVMLYLLASMSAEFFADMALAPWEAVKVKMQVTRHYPPYLRVVMPRMWATEGIAAFYKGLPPLWARQIPYTMMKFSSFEKFVALISYYFVTTPKCSTPKSIQLFVSVVAGLLAGTLCAIVSHPADTVVSKMNQKSDGKSNVLAFVAALGCAEIWKGLPLRIVMIGTLTALQWLIYDSFKVFVGLPTTGTKC